MGRNVSLHDLANIICTIENELSLTAYVFPEENKCFVLLSGLKEEFEIKKIIRSESHEQNFEALVSRLKQAENEMNEKDTFETSSSFLRNLAVHAKTEQSHNKPKRCDICKRPDHVKWNCFFNPN